MSAVVRIVVCTRPDNAACANQCALQHSLRVVRVFWRWLANKDFQFCVYDVHQGCLKLDSPAVNGTHCLDGVDMADHIFFTQGLGDIDV